MFTPSVSNLSALPCPEAPVKGRPRQATSTSTNPAFWISATYSPSRRAPPIHAVQISTSSLAAAGMSLLAGVNGFVTLFVALELFSITLYAMCAGHPPFRAESQQALLKKHISEKPIPVISLVPDVTQEFSDLLLKCLAKKRDDRPASFHDVLKTLNHIRVYKDDPSPKK